jgi:hypothetical protein
VGTATSPEFFLYKLSECMDLCRAQEYLKAGGGPRHAELCSKFYTYIPHAVGRCVCVCEREDVCERDRVCVCVREDVCVRDGMCVCVCDGVWRLTR